MRIEPKKANLLFVIRETWIFTQNTFSGNDILTNTKYVMTETDFLLARIIK